MFLGVFEFGLERSDLMTQWESEFQTFRNLLNFKFNLSRKKAFLKKLTNASCSLTSGLGHWKLPFINVSNCGEITIFIYLHAQKATFSRGKIKFFIFFVMLHRRRTKRATTTKIRLPIEVKKPGYILSQFMNWLLKFHVSNVSALTQLLVFLVGIKLGVTSSYNNFNIITVLYAFLL